MAEVGKLERIQVEGFKSMKSLNLTLRRINVLIGPNGAGKSNFIGFFRFMSALEEKRLQLYVKQQGGAGKFLHFGEKETHRITVKLYFPPNTYECALVPTVSGGLVFERERCFFHGSDIGYQGDSLISLAKAGDEESGLPVNAGEPTPQGWTLRRMQRWRLYHFHDTSESAPVKKQGNIHDVAMLRPDAENLAAYLFLIRSTDQSSYREIVATVRRVAPFFQDFILEPVPDRPQDIRLQWKHVGTDAYFDANDLSDGTLRFICLATLFLQPKPPPTILIDEPELGLHPHAVQILAGLIRSTSAKTQIVASTQSVTFANEFEPEDLLVVDREENASVFRRPTEEQLKGWLEDYRLGDLWEKNVLGGTP
jgi:predicted ATPase